MTIAEHDNSSQNEPGRPVNGNFKLQVSDDQMAVYLCELSPASDGGEALSLDSVLAELELQKITVAIDKDKINAILASANTESSEEQICIATGVAPIEGVDGELVWNIPAPHMENGCAVVLPGEVIATYKAATMGSPGKTVFGEAISVSSGTNKFPRIGNGIETCKTDVGDEYSAVDMGLVVFEQEDDAELVQVSVPMEVTDDGMDARLDIFGRSSAGKEIDCEDVLAVLAKKEIVHGIDQAVIQESLKKALKLSSEEQIGCVKDVIVASGTPSQEGKNARLIISHDETTAGAELSNGRMDFHEHNYPWNVSKDEKVGYLLAAKPAIAGTPVYGGTLEVEPVEEIEVDLEGLHKDEQGRLIADIDGALIMNGTHISVVDLLVINGDVAQKTGNVHSKTPVHVKGHVEPGFVLESQKDIIVEKNVEDATVRSGSSIMIKGGVRGMKSEIYSPSDVIVGFVENASVFVNGDLTVNRSIINSIVATNGSVVVGSKKAKRSMVVGGELTAHKLIELVELGSNSYAKTILRLGVAQEERRQINNLDKELDEFNSKLEQINQIEYHHKQSPKADTEEVLSKVALTRESLQLEISSIEEKKSQVLDQVKESESGKVVVNKCVYPGVVISINEHSYEVERELGAGSFIYDKDLNSVIFVPA